MLDLLVLALNFRPVWFGQYLSNQFQPALTLNSSVGLIQFGVVLTQCVSLIVKPSTCFIVDPVCLYRGIFDLTQHRHRKQFCVDADFGMDFFSHARLGIISVSSSGIHTLVVILGTFELNFELKVNRFNNFRLKNISKVEVLQPHYFQCLCPVLY